jgi:hypothetical protein
MNGMEDAREAYRQGRYEESRCILGRLVMEELDYAAFVFLLTPSIVWPDILNNKRLRWEMYNNALKLDNPIDLYFVGMSIYMGNNGFSCDKSLAYILLHKAGLKGHLYAAYECGMGMMLRGEKSAGLQLVQRTADQGVAPAQFAIGELFSFGI